ncbi:heme ABC exporter ATP-binding protein CcmA [Hyphomicrobium sp.]|uniref:heme ABC exporter ATP-binding protein CcmA n=1 Tax=Hyphomicrobium sp. TaxID=82 RepID=UPI002E37884A|nr:heme ABC exporter ATP-binding protein CcmA [Hyphomicrobium sp.]HEX2840762.1 heme ABC exporter ATP-binding protein CcmA [Hyphomicrobium sp.]
MHLQADNLTVERGTRTVISNLSFTAQAGEALLLVGPNGAGKTTLIRTLAGFIAPVSGTISLKGDSANRDVAEVCHYVGHLTGIKANLTAEQNLAFWGEYLGGDRATLADRVDAALGDFGLAALADFPAGLLSAGQKRRLGLARLSIATRPIWLLDEPTVSLDAASTELLARLIQQHLARDGLVIAATHLPLGLERPVYLRLGPSPGTSTTQSAGLPPVEGQQP